MPGRTSNTAMPDSASRAANSLLIIDRPALEMQYSPRATDTTSLLTELMMMIERWPSAGGAASMRQAIFWVRKNGPRRLMSRQRS